MANIDDHCGQKEIAIRPAIDVRLLEANRAVCGLPSYEPVGSLTVLFFLPRTT